MFHNGDGSGTPALVQSLAMTSQLSVTGTSAGGSITLDFSGGNFVPGGGLTVNTNDAVQTLNVIGGNPFALNVTGTGMLALGAVQDKVLVLSGLNLEPDSTLELNTQGLLLRAPDAPTREAMLAAVSGWVQNARDAGAWDKSGITSSAAKQKAYTGLAATLNSKGDVVVKYVWNGDANLDGVVDAADYFKIDSGFITQKKGWLNGDFNYDGVVDAADYFLIDSAFIAQTGPLSVSKPQPVVSAGVGVQQKAKKADPDNILSQLFSTEPVL